MLAKLRLPLKIVKKGKRRRKVKEVKMPDFGEKPPYPVSYTHLTLPTTERV